MPIKFKVNGNEVNTELDPLTRLIDFIRDELKLTGTKEGCGEGECGACAVFLDGKVVNSCLVPIALCEGKEVMTIEGYTETERGKVVVQSFLDEGAVQCGFCIPGMVMSSEVILRDTNGKPTEEEVRKGLSGNLCRCTGYDHIVNAVLRASDIASKEGKKIMVETFIAKNIDEALYLKSKHDAIVFAGGTDLMVEYLRGSNLIAKFEKPVVFINSINELKGIKEDENNIIIGAATTFDEIIKSDLTPQVLKESASGIAGPPIRNIATIGGNICNASPSADSLPSLYAMDTVLRLKSKDSQRDIKIKDFITGVSKTTIKNDEILTHVIIPKKNYEYSFYRKIGTRKANALSKLAMCALALKENDKYRFKISFCTLGVTVTRDESIEEKFASSNIDDWKNNINSIQEAYSAIMKPRDSARSTALYRKQCALNLIKYFIEDICKK